MKFNSKCQDTFSSSSDRKQKGTDDREKRYHTITLQNNLLLNLINGSWFLLKWLTFLVVFLYPI